MNYQAVEFKANDGTVLRGRYYVTQNQMETHDRAPLILVIGGFGSVVAVRNYVFAEMFAAAGYSVLIYDHRNFGLSDGAIRHEIDPSMQISDIRDAITFAQTLPHVDSEKIGVWGSSLGGGHALVIGATDHRVKCIVAQVPFVSGNQTLARLVRADFQPQMQESFAADRLARMNGETPIMLPVVSADPMGPAALPTHDAWTFINNYIHEDPSWKNEVTLRSMESVTGYEPGIYAPLITPTPLLVIAGKYDSITPPDLALDLYERACHPKKLKLINGGHFSPYDTHLDEAMSSAIEWFDEYLK